MQKTPQEFLEKAWQFFCQLVLAIIIWLLPFGMYECQNYVNNDLLKFHKK